MAKSIVPITMDMMEHIIFVYAKKNLENEEPIPDFHKRYADRLESCLCAPFQSYDGNDLYPDLESKAAIFFYLMIKNHPFENGNKRIAIVALLYFLLRNKKWLSVKNDNLYKLTKIVAKSKATKKDFILTNIKSFIAKNLI